MTSLSPSCPAPSPRSRKSSPQPPLDAEEDGQEPGNVAVNHSHTKKAFRVMNDLRSKLVSSPVFLHKKHGHPASPAVPTQRCCHGNGDMSESKAKRVEIKDVDGQTLTKLVDYVYTAEIEVTEENVQVTEHSSEHRECSVTTAGQGCTVTVLEFHLYTQLLK
ncbi:UNVERIFIED_CONTAM: hypothetical protein FKN15_065974 [Acipenser sinensis]